MANSALFSQRSAVPAATAHNEAGGRAYRLKAEHALAQYVMTGCLNDAYYADAQTQLDQLLAFAAQCEPAFVAQTAIYARQHGYMKDTPALLAAWLSVHGPQYLPQVFAETIDNGRMVRNFVQILRSGQVGRRSLGTRPKRLVQEWLCSRSPRQLLQASVGQQPSLRDLLRMVHPRPKDPAQAAMFAYFAGKPYDLTALPDELHALEGFKQDQSEALPDVPFQLLTALPLTSAHWAQIARQAPWQMTRMNLNTFARHGVFNKAELTTLIAARLADPKQVAKARVFPYQLLSAYKQTGSDVPRPVREALQAALQASLVNVPALDGRVAVLVDVSGSMHCPVTGHRAGATSTVRCIDAAALVAAALAAKNRNTRVMPFDTRVRTLGLDANASVLANATRLAKYGGGGTNCAAPLTQLNAEKAMADLVIYVSDNQSWFTPGSGYSGQAGTAVMREWERFKRRNPKARMVCIDIQPYATSQAQERADILNIGGFSDVVFKLIGQFAKGQMDAGHWVAEINRVQLASGAGRTANSAQG